jgi:hypothetical protein
MAVNWTLPLRGVQMLFAFLVLVLCGVAISKFGGGYGSLGFLLFCGIWAILSLIYLLVAPSVLAGFHNVYIILVLEFLNMIFFFAGFIAVAAAIGTFNCDLLDDEFGFGSDLKTGCQTTKAATAFGAFSWLLWLVTLILVVRQVYLERQGHVSHNGGVPAVAKDEHNIAMSSNPNV